MSCTPLSKVRHWNTFMVSVDIRKHWEWGIYQRPGQCSSEKVQTRWGALRPKLPLSRIHVGRSGPSLASQTPR